MDDSALARDTTVSRRQLLARVGAATVAVPLGSGLLAACSTSDAGSPGSGGGDLLAHLKQTGVARVAIANEPPYTKVTTNGHATGVEPDVAQAVLKSMGINQIEGIITPYESMIPGLQARRWDMITAGLFMKQSRCAQVLYSEPVLVSTESFAVAPGNPKQITSLTAVKRNPKLKIAVLPGGFEDGVLKRENVPRSQSVNVPDGRSGIEALKAGRCDAFFLPTLSLNALQEDTQDFDITPAVQDVPKTGSGAAFRKQDRSFVAAYNAKLRAFKRTPDYASTLRKWGFDPAAVKGVTTQQLCASPD